MLSLGPLLRALRIAVVSALAIAPGACAGPPGAVVSVSGDAGAPDAGAAGGGTNGVISDLAQHGLDISPVPLDLASLTTAQIEQVGRGSYLVNAVAACNTCHDGLKQGEFLSGGRRFDIDATHYVTARNLTPEPTTGLHLTEDQFIEAIRTGKDFAKEYAGEALVVMPWPSFRWIGTDDLKAIYAYLQVIPPVSQDTIDDNKSAIAGAPDPFPTSYNEGDQTRPLPPETDYLGEPVPDPGHVLRGLAVVPLQDPPALATMTATKLAAFGRGAYLVKVADCNRCHTNPSRDLTAGSDYLHINTAGYLSGGHVFGVPHHLLAVLHELRSMSQNLVGATNGSFHEDGWSFARFNTLIQTGVHADDNPPLPLGYPMPWQTFHNMTLGDLTALYTYIDTLARSEPATGANDKPTQPYARWCASSTDCDTAAGETCHIDSFGKFAGLGECIGTPCTSDRDCGACQTCGGNGRCAAPAADSACLAQGI